MGSPLVIKIRFLCVFLPGDLSRSRHLTQFTTTPRVFGFHFQFLVAIISYLGLRCSAPHMLQSNNSGSKTGISVGGPVMVGGFSIVWFKAIVEIFGTLGVESSCVKNKGRAYKLFIV